MGDRLATAFENMYTLYKMRRNTTVGTEREVADAE